MQDTIPPFVFVWLIGWAIVLACLFIYSQFQSARIYTRYHKQMARLEYEKWRLEMIHAGLPPPDPWDEEVIDR